MFSKILVLNSHFSVRKGGAELQISYLVPNLFPSSSILYLSISSNYRFRYLKYSLNERILLIPKLKLLRRLGLSKSIDAIRFFILVCVLRPDIIVSRGSLGYLSLILKFWKRIPLIYFVASDKELQKSHFVECLSLKNMSRFFLVVQTFNQHNFFKREFNIAPTVFRNIHIPTEGGVLETNKEELLFVGNFKSVKRPEEILNLSVLLPTKSIAVIGNNIEYNRSLHDRLMGRPNVFLYGEQPRTIVRTLMKNCNYLINTSLFEGFLTFL